jgi:hypothetical protein
MTTSHLTYPASEKLLDGHPKDAGQVIGYSHSTDETPSHSTRLLKDSNQVAGYRLSAEEIWPGTRKAIAKYTRKGYDVVVRGLTPQQHTQAGYHGSLLLDER